MLKTDVRSAQEMFKMLGYEKDEKSLNEMIIYENEYQSITIVKGGIVTFNKSEIAIPTCSLTIKEIEAIYKQIKELEQC